MVVVALHLTSQAVLPVGACLGVGLAPEVWCVGYDEQSETVGPVELAGHFHLYVHAVAVEPEALGDEYLVAHILVGGEGIETVGAETLVEGELQVDGLVVQGDVWIVGSRQVDDAYLALSEIAADGIAAAEICRDLIEERVVEVPEVLVLYGHHERCFLSA